MELTHLCTVEESHSGTYLPPLPPDATSFMRFKRKFRTWTLISEKHPKCIEYFKNSSGLRNERERHANSRNVHIIHPFSLFRIYYEFFMMVVYFMIFVSQSFGLNYRNTLEITEMFPQALCHFCLIGMIVTFFSGYVKADTKEIILDQSKIARHYVRSLYFFVDLFGFTPVFYITAFLDDDWDLNKMCHVIQVTIRIFRLYTLNRYALNTAEYFELQNKKIIRVLLLIISLILLVHYFGFLLFYVPYLHIFKYHRFQKDSWVRRSNLHNNVDKAYAETFFLASSFFLSCGKGLINISLWQELLLVIFIMVFGIFYVILTEVIVLLMMHSSRTLERKYRQIINQLNEYMNYKHLPPEMRKRLLMYYEYKYHGKFFREEAINSTLPDVFKRDIKMHVCKQLVSNVSLFADLPASIVSDILEYLKKEIYLPNDIIIKAGDSGDCLYLLSTGTVAVYTPTGREVCHLEDGAYFGEISLIMKDHYRTANVIAVEICEVYSLQRNHFKSYFLGNETLYQKLYQKAEDRMEMLVGVEEYYKKKGFRKPKK